MSKKLIVLALAAVSAAMFALPAVAMAGEWEISTPEQFTEAGKEAKLTVKKIEESETVSEIKCTEHTGSGKYTTKTTGEELTITFKGCVVESVANSECHSPGQANGIIKTTDLTFHNTMLETTANGGNIGVLITPGPGGEGGGGFASFTCSVFGIQVASITIGGNGVIGEVEKKCTERGFSGGVTFTSSATGVQTWMQKTTEGEKFDLTATQGGKTRTASIDLTSSASFNNQQTITCP